MTEDESEPLAVETLIAIGTVLGGLGALVAAGAAIFAAVFTYRLMKSGQEQVELSQQQVYDQQRPVLVPSGKPFFQEGHENWLHWTAEWQPLMLRNLGTGTAFNVASVLYGCLSYVMGDPPNFGRSDESSGIHWTCWLGIPIAAGEEVEAAYKPGAGVFLRENSHIDAFVLNAPYEPSPNEIMSGEAIWVTARLTTTYQDIFGRKHASIFEWVNNRGWQRLAILTNISCDLHDQEGWTTERIPRIEEQPAAPSRET